MSDTLAKYVELVPRPALNCLAMQSLISCTPHLSLAVLWWDSGPRDPPTGWDGCDNYTLSSEPVQLGSTAGKCMHGGCEEELGMLGTWGRAAAGSAATRPRPPLRLLRPGAAYYCFSRFNSTSIEYYSYGLDENKTGGWPGSACLVAPQQAVPTGLPSAGGAACPAAPSHAYTVCFTA